MDSNLIKIAYHWQGLLGSMIGAATPILFWFFIQWQQHRRKNKESLIYLEKLIVYNINNAIDAGATIKYFIDNRLSQLLTNIRERAGSDKYSVDTAFFPLFATYPIEGNILNIHTESGYLNNKIVQISKMSKDFSLIIDDLRTQFRDTIEINREIAFNKLNGPEAQRLEYKENIERFIKVIEQDFFEKTLKVYLKVLAEARAVISAIFEIGYFRWHAKFEPHFKFFKSKKEFIEFRMNSYDKVDEFLKEKVEKQLKEFKNRDQE